MKISNYNQLLAVSTLLSGMIIFATLWSQYQKVEHISRAHFESQLLVQTIEHLSTMSQVWLTTQDLLFSGKQTYLANGINAQSDQLTQMLLAIDIKDKNKTSASLIKQLVSTIKNNKAIIASFSQLSMLNNQDWQTTIAESDALTTDYVSTLEQLLAQVLQKNTSLYKELSVANRYLKSITLITISLYLVLIFFIVTWFSKYIVKPIENITAVAQQSNNEVQSVEFRQINAPVEIIALSSAIQSFTQRITIEKEKAEQERLKVTQINKQINTIMNTIPCTLLLLDEQGIIQECTPEASKLFSKPKDEIINKNIAVFLPALATLDGEFDTETALKSAEESLLAPNFENPYIEFSGRKIAIKESVSYLLTITDINERKHSQKALSSLNQQLVNAEKLASIGQLSAGIAHEINNPVGYIRSNLDMLADYIKALISYITIVNTAEQPESAKALYQEEDLAYILNDIEPLISSSLEGTIRISNIIKDLGNYAHADNIEPELICIDKLIEQSLALVANELKYKVNIVKCLDANVNIMGFPQKLLQVFINMLVNASHAITSNGRISITSYIDQDEINISFEDNGSGISQAHLKNIFDPFFTTKPVGKGTGLGLHIVRSIIDDHNGHIEVSSIIDKGSKFTIYLPIHKKINSA
ncbi:MAG: PAS domain-containing protein [Colwellia sp.]|nr:PAS domain-containing protein [Colwellia sp.]